MRSAGSELKTLTTRRQVLQAELSEVRYQIPGISSQLSDIRKRESEIQRKLSDITKRLTSLHHDAPIVTEHAVLRFLERGMGMDMEDIRNQILTDAVKGLIVSGLEGKVGISQGCTAIVRNGVVVSIVGGAF